MKKETIGHIDHGKTKLTRKQKFEQLSEPKEICRDDFETESEWINFLDFTKPIPVRIKKAPKMPCYTLREYLDQYNLVINKKDNLTGTQRAIVKNVIHDHVRKGTIILTKE